MRIVWLGFIAFISPAIASAEPQGSAVRAFSLPEPKPAPINEYIPTVDKPMRFSSSGIALRVTDALQPDGTKRENRGIIAGVEVLPDTVVGLGIFEMSPKKQSVSGPARFDGPAKQSRKAAIGMTLRF